MAGGFEAGFGNYVSFEGIVKVLWLETYSPLNKEYTCKHIRLGDDDYMNI